MSPIVPGPSTAALPLGYGCSLLMGGISRADSLRLLKTAFDCGIRHFDTAPSYGYGQAEGVLGEALGASRHQITITTKYGIRPPRNQSLLGLARGIILPMVKLAPAIKSRLSRAAGGLKARTQFSPEELLSSIDASLAALRTDYIDILLLHEADVGDLNDDLLAALQRSVAAGKIRGFGVGSDAAARLYRADRRFCSVMQFEWSVLSGGKPSYPGSFLITHRSLSGNFVRLTAWLDAHPQVARAWSSRLDVDVASASVLARLMLAAARDANPDGLTLFSSRNPRNIQANAQLFLDQPGLRTGAEFAALVARDAAPTLAQSQIGVAG